MRIVRSDEGCSKLRYPHYRREFIMDRSNFDRATDAEKDLEQIEATVLKEAEQYVEAVDGDGNREQEAAIAARDCRRVCRSRAKDC